MLASVLINLFNIYVPPECKFHEVRNCVYFCSMKQKARASLVAQWFKNLPANAGDMGSSPGLGRSHMPQSN